MSCVSVIIPAYNKAEYTCRAIDSVLAVKTDGTVWSWGGNAGQSPGNGVAAASQATPVQVSCPKGTTGFLNLNNAGTCAPNAQFTVKVTKNTATLPATLSVNGATVALPCEGDLRMPNAPRPTNSEAGRLHRDG